MSNNEKKTKGTGWKRNILEWIGIGVVIAIFYFTGLHKIAAGAIQRAVLWTGLLNPTVEQVTETAATALPETAYQLALAKPNGEQIQLKEFKNNVLFINIWASWCPPCVAEMPTIETLYNQVSDNKNITFLLISLDQKQKKAANFMSNHNFPMPFYFPVNGLPAAFRSPAIPTTYVISRNGKIIYKKKGIANYSSNSFKEWLLHQAGKSN